MDIFGSKPVNLEFNIDISLTEIRKKKKNMLRNNHIVIEFNFFTRSSPRTKLLLFRLQYKVMEQRWLFIVPLSISSYMFTLVFPIHYYS